MNVAEGETHELWVEEDVWDAKADGGRRKAENRQMHQPFEL
jgi:hypothetical protein